MQQCHFNIFAIHLCRYGTSACVFSCKFAAYLQKTFLQKHLWWTVFEATKTDAKKKSFNIFLILVTFFVKL